MDGIASAFIIITSEIVVNGDDMRQTIVGFAGSLSAPSRTRALVEAIVARAAGRFWPGAAGARPHRPAAVPRRLGPGVRPRPRGAGQGRGAVRGGCAGRGEPGLQGQLYRPLQAPVRPDRAQRLRREAGAAGRHRRRRPARAGDRAPTAAALRVLRGALARHRRLRCRARFRGRRSVLAIGCSNGSTARWRSSVRTSRRATRSRGRPPSPSRDTSTTGDFHDLRR